MVNWCPWEVTDIVGQLKMPLMLACVNEIRKEDSEEKTGKSKQHDKNRVQPSNRPIYHHWCAHWKKSKRYIHILPLKNTILSYYL